MKLLLLENHSKSLHTVLGMIYQGPVGLPQQKLSEVIYHFVVHPNYDTIECYVQGEKVVE